MVLLITLVLIYAGGLFLTLKEDGTKYSPDFFWPLSLLKVYGKKLLGRFKAGDE